MKNIFFIFIITLIFLHQCSYLKKHNPNEVLNPQDNKHLFSDKQYYKNGILKYGVLKKRAKFKSSDYTLTHEPNRIYFHKNGLIMLGFITNGSIVKINDYKIRCKKKIEFHKNGMIARVLLVTNTILKVNKKLITFWSYNYEHDITFYTNGAVRSGYVCKKEKYRINQKTLQFYTVSFYQNGKISAGLLVGQESFKIGTYTLLIGNNKPDLFIDNIWFYQNGNIKAGELSKDTSLIISGRRIKFKKKSFISFYLNGNVRVGKLMKNTKIKINAINIIFKADSWIFFYKNGNIKEGTLAMNINVTGKIFKGGSKVEFDRKGKIIN